MRKLMAEMLLEEPSPTIRAICGRLWRVFQVDAEALRKAGMPEAAKGAEHYADVMRGINKGESFAEAFDLVEFVRTRELGR